MSCSKASADVQVKSPYDLSVELLITAHELKGEKDSQLMSSFIAGMGASFGLNPDMQRLPQLAQSLKSPPTAEQLESKVRELILQLFEGLGLDPKQAVEKNVDRLKAMDVKTLGFTLWLLGRILVAARMLDEIPGISCGDLVLQEDPYKLYEQTLIYGLEHAKHLAASTSSTEATTLWAHAYLLVSFGLIGNSEAYNQYHALFKEIMMVPAADAVETLSNQMWVNGMYLYAHSFRFIAQIECFNKAKETLIQQSGKGSLVEAATQVVTPKDWGTWFSATICLALHQQKQRSDVQETRLIREKVQQTLDRESQDLEQAGYNPFDVQLAGLYLP